jgi:hypothetical protein
VALGHFGFLSVGAFTIVFHSNGFCVCLTQESHSEDGISSSLTC